MKIKIFMMAAATVFAGLTTGSTAEAQDNYLGEIIVGGWNFCPRGTAKLDGQLLAISSNSALFSLLGTTYGGDGRTTFALPDLRGRTPIHNGNGPGLADRRLGQSGGSETNLLTESQLPSHTHRSGVRVSTDAANTTNPVGGALGVAAENIYTSNDEGLGNTHFLDDDTLNILNTGGGQAQNNMQPFLTLQYCIVLQGIFPSRN